MFADHLHQGITEFAAPYRAKPTVGLSQELFCHWQARFSESMAPVIGVTNSSNLLNMSRTAKGL